MTPIPPALRSALIDAMGGWGPYSVNEILNLFQDYDFFERDLSVQEQGMRRTAAGEFLNCIDWGNAAQRKRLLALIDDVLTHYPVPEGEPDKSPGGRLRKVLARVLQKDASPSDDEFSDVLQTLDADHLKESWQKALERRHGEPEGAITAARTTLESVCKLILDDLDVEHEDKDDLPALYKRAAKELRLAPDDHLEQAFKQILGGCMTVVNGLATLRNQLSDAHGKGKGATTYIQVKSGPDTANRDIAQNIGGLLNAARRRDPGAICLFGVCYARPEQISQIVRGQLDERGVGLKVGREFWEFISGDPGCLDELLVIASAAADEAEPGESSFVDRVEAKLAALTNEFHDRYGTTLDEATWRRFLADNS